AGPYAQVLDDGHGPHAGGDAGGCQAVDILHGQAGVGDRAMCGLHQDFHVGIAVRFAQAGMAHAGDGGNAAEIGQGHHARPPACLKTSVFSPSMSATSACTAMPMDTASGAMPCTRDIRRTPSSRSISATL